MWNYLYELCGRSSVERPRENIGSIVHPPAGTSARAARLRNGRPCEHGATYRDSLRRAPERVGSRSRPDPGSPPPTSAAGRRLPAQVSVALSITFSRRCSRSEARTGETDFFAVCFMAHRRSNLRWSGNLSARWCRPVEGPLFALEPGRQPRFTLRHPVRRAAAASSRRSIRSCRRPRTGATGADPRTGRRPTPWAASRPPIRKYPPADPLSREEEDVITTASQRGALALCHIAYQADFEQRMGCYQRNEKFAGGGRRDGAKPARLIQDYHFALCRG